MWAPVRDEGLTTVGILTSSVTLFLVNIINVSILYTHVHDSKEAGLLAANVFDLILQKTSFIGNTPNCANSPTYWHTYNKRLHVTAPY